MNCPTPEQLDELFLRGNRTRTFADGSVQQFGMLPFFTDWQQVEYRELYEHVQQCPHCRQACADRMRVLTELQRTPIEEVDPGDDFTDRILRKAKRSLPDRLWRPQWIPLGRAAAWALAVATVIAVILLQGQVPTPGSDQVIAGVPPQIIADGPCAFPVYVTTRDGRPIRNAKVTVEYSSGYHQQTLATGRTGRDGLYQARVTLPHEERDYYRPALQVQVTTGSGLHYLQVPVATTELSTLYLSTDKPLYQPGQTMHLRALCLHRTATTPVKGRKITLTVRDPRDTLLTKQVLTSSEWGIATADFTFDSAARLGDYTVEASIDGQRQTRTVTLSRYTLPKFAATLTTRRGWFLPGEVIDGTLDARYLFGKPCAGATVRMEAKTDSGLGAEVVARAQGQADAQGRFAFRLPVPNRLIGSAAEGGSALLSVTAVVTDAGGSQREVTRQFPVARQAILLSVLPEAGAPVAGVENRFYVIASYPDGSPARAQVTITHRSTITVTTNEHGIGVFTHVPESRVQVTALARDGEGHTGRYQGTLSSVGERLGRERAYQDPVTERPYLEAPRLLIRTDKAMYEAGEVARVLVLAPGDIGNAVYLQVTRDQQPVLTKILPLTRGSAVAEIPLSEDMGGLLAIEAFLPGEMHEVEPDEFDPYGEERSLFILGARGSRSMLVKPAEGLRIKLDGIADAKPGEERQVSLRVTDKSGHGVPAAVGLSGVDEAVYALEDQYPGMARLFFLLQQELQTPTLEVHEQQLPSAYRLAQNLPADQEIARVAMAAYQSQGLLTLSQSTERLSQMQTYYRAREMGVRIWQVVGVAALLLTLLGYCGLLRHAGDGEEAVGCSIFSALAMSLIVVPMLINQDAAVLGAMIALGWWVTVLTTRYRLLGATPSVKLVTNILILGVIIAVFASIMFPVFAKAREKSRQSAGGYAGRIVTQSLEEINDQRTKPATSASATVRVREYFPETLTWQPEIVTDAEGKATLTLPAADSITTWRLNLLANSKDGRLGSASLPYKVFQPFFVDIDVPVQLTVGDTLRVPVAVHNYAGSAQTVTLTLEAGNGLRPAGATRISLKVPAGGVAQAGFPVRATAHGQGQLTVNAVSGSLRDAIRRHITVVPPGIRREETTNTVLRTTGTLSIQLPRGTDLSAADLDLRFYPGPVSSTLAGLEGLLQRPYGCFEQTTSTTYPNVMVLQYLQAHDSKDIATMARAREYAGQGYQRLLTFEVPGGGFSLFGDAPASFSLTAVGLAEFQDMAQVMTVDERLLTRTAQWLVAHWDKASSLDRSLAALPLARAGQRTLVQGWISEAAKMRGALSTYELAVLAAAATDTGHPASGALGETLAARAVETDSGRCWPRLERGRHFRLEAWQGWDDCETTGLAVQALARLGSYAALTRDGTDYLIHARHPDGGWSGTQATVQALRALLAVDDAGARGTIAITVNGKSVPGVTLHGDRVVPTVHLGRYLRSGRNTVELRAKAGVNPACQLTAGYYVAAPPAKAPTPPLTVTYDKHAVRVNEVATARVRAQVPARMELAMLDLPVPPGFTPIMDDLAALQQRGVIERYESSGTQLILYVTALEAGQPLTFSYGLRARFPVKATVAPARLYPFYQPQNLYCTPAETLRVR